MNTRPSLLQCCICFTAVGVLALIVVKSHPMPLALVYVATALEFALGAR